MSVIWKNTSGASCSDRAAHLTRRRLFCSFAARWRMAITLGLSGLPSRRRGWPRPRRATPTGLREPRLAHPLVGRDSAALEQAAGRYSALLPRARATEDAGLAWAAAGDQDQAVTWLRRAYELYQQPGAVDGMARVRAELRAAGVSLHHWKRAARPAFGWASLTETEWRVADLVAQGLSNREVAGKVFLSTHTVAYHLRHIYWKLNVGSRVQLARLAADQAVRESE